MIAILLTAALLVSSTMATTFQACGDQPQPLAVRVVGCDSQPCTFTHGETVHAEVDFSADHEVAHIKPEAVATVFGVEVGYPLPDDGCSTLVDSACPVESGDIVTYLLELPIVSPIPSIDVINVRLALENSDDLSDVLTCFSIDLSVE